MAPLILLAVGGVLALSFTSARTNTLELLRDRADVGLTLLENRVRGQLDPVADAGTGLAGMFFGGMLDPADEASIATAFRGALSAVPQVTAFIFIGTDLNSVRVSRGGDPLVEVVNAGIEIIGMGGMTETQAGVEAMLAGAAEMDAAAWLPPLWVQNLKQPVLTLEIPVRMGGEFAGVLFAVVEMGSLVRFLDVLQRREAANAFIRPPLHPRAFAIARHHAGRGGHRSADPRPRSSATRPSPASRGA